VFDGDGDGDVWTRLNKTLEWRVYLEFVAFVVGTNFPAEFLDLIRIDWTMANR
jgi:hypothetical protein